MLFCRTFVGRRWPICRTILAWWMSSSALTLLVGHLTRKIVPDIHVTYNVFGGTLNPTLLYYPTLIENNEVFWWLTSTVSFLVVGDSWCWDNQCSIDLTQKVARRCRRTEVHTETVGPHQTPMFTLLRRVVDRPVRYVLAERMRLTR